MPAITRVNGSLVVDANSSAGIPSRTVAYWLCGAGYAETAAVSMHWLRKTWPGNISLCYCPIDRSNVDAVYRLAYEFGCEPVKVEPLNLRRHRHYVTKAVLWKYLRDFRQVVYLDADTVPVGSVEPLFDDRLTVTWWAGWVCGGKKIGGRVQRALNVLGEAGVPCVPPEASEPAINTGVMGWSDRVDLREWERLCMVGHRAPLTDELMLQMLCRQYRAEGMLRVKDDRWNCSPTYGANQQDVRVWHFHGRRHIRREDGRANWRPLARDAVRERVALREWWGEFDQAVPRVIELVG